MKILFLGGFFLLGVQPILLMGSLVGLVFLYSLSIYMVEGSFWFSYIFMLIMLSGVLVLFSYMLSLFPNEEFELKSVSLVLMFFFMGYLVDEDYFFFLDYSDYSISMWIYMLGFMTMFLMLFLLSMMIIVVWLSMMDEGSVRE